MSIERISASFQAINTVSKKKKFSTAEEQRKDSIDGNNVQSIWEEMNLGVNDWTVDTTAETKKVGQSFVTTTELKPICNQVMTLMTHQGEEV